MKKVISGNGKMSKDAKETVQECVSEFISFMTGEASDRCQREKRKTINGDDIIRAIQMLGFEDYVNPLKHYLNKYRELDEGEKLNIPTSSNNKQQHYDPSYDNVYIDSPSAQASFLSTTDQSCRLPACSQNSIQSHLSQQEQTDSLKKICGFDAFKSRFAYVTHNM
ncbi:hypothetical protein RND71_025723 [Anisodus tanguticus]|uniref:Transcription factor CBF/NF-Y/archaeal histone domain-containing protein n=1 Tax=Anisodus tanguticus TaxID=243964 RepID=A0AAE1V9S6_9SOLA|nr:hypothetical protein RND71_025723 [Anisodus tanguticus]